MRIRFALPLLLISTLAAACAPAVTTGAPADGPAAESAPTAEAGLFGVEQEGQRLRFVVPDSLLGREMVVLSRLVAAQEGLALGGDRLGPNLMVRWERQGNRILLRAPSFESTAERGTPLALAVEQSSFAPVIASFDVEGRRDGGSVIDVSDLYLGDGSAFGLDRRRRQQYQVRRYDPSRSNLEMARAFPKNVEIRVLRSYEADNPPSSARGGTISYEVNHSMVLLPEEPMRPRLYDERVGYISTGQIEYADDAQGVRNRQYIRRFRLEPSDTAAYLRGELVDPVEPIVWYIDPATPEWMRPYFEEGLLEWNAAFEEAGFRDAIQVRVAPTKEEDPDFSLLDARYSVVRYVATPVRSANATGDVVDPRSGEVIRGHINMYQGVQERLRWWLLSQVGAANPELQSARIPQSAMGEALRYVVSHEMAHAVGFPHNQRANFVFPVDSLRNPDFVERMGHSASSVGRTRFNYIAQPGDGISPERRIGIWDRFAIMWGYRPIVEAGSPDDELRTLNQWVVERADRPWFRFGYPQFGMDDEWDPYRMTEGISDDPVEAAVYGMNNLRAATANLMSWLLEEGDDYQEVGNYYLQNLTQWNRYAEHAASAVGGYWTHLKRFGEEGPIYTAIEPEYQQKAMRFIDEHVLQTPEWALDMDMLRRIEHAGAVERIRAYQVLAVQRLLNHARLARLIEQEAFLGSATYGPSRMLDDTREMVWREVRNGAATDTYRRNLQRGYLEQAHYLLHEAESESWNPPASGNLRVSRDDDPPLNAHLHIGQSDIRPLVRDQLGLLRGEIRTTLSRGVGDRMTRIHLEDALHRIDETLGSS